MKRSIILLFAFCAFGTAIPAQSITVPFDDKAWDLSRAETQLENYMGKNSLRLAGGEILLPAVNFYNGTIEVDINFPAQRGFPGIFWRQQDRNNMEHFYVRPHQSGNPDACQYTPVFNGLASWQLYHGEGYGKAIQLTPDEWHHIKIEVKGSQAFIYFDDMTTPAVEVKKLKSDFPAGRIGLNAGPAVHVANFSYQLDSASYPVQQESAPSDPDQIASWLISPVLDNERFAGKTLLSKSDMAGLSWTEQATEASGLLNLARYGATSEGKSTVVAKLNITASEAQIKPLAFGYSDMVAVYVNGKLQYGGHNIFQSRDYRYLGTIGYFDVVYLDLKPGDNEVWFVITENFGGWGIQAKWL